MMHRRYKEEELGWNVQPSGNSIEFGGQETYMYHSNLK